MDWLIVVVASLVSGFLGVAISIVYYRRHEKRQMKLKTLKDFAANRYDVQGEQFTRALNEVFIAFSESPKVKLALKRFHENVRSPMRSEDLDQQYLVELFKSMCDDLGINTGEFTDSFFLTPFNLKR
ncbi:MAG: DUF6680 family protein [Chloroflexota bacterium]|nr:DUF6680 family protein [Chloroflexota bacterium]